MTPLLAPRAPSSSLLYPWSGSDLIPVKHPPEGLPAFCGSNWEQLLCPWCCWRQGRLPGGVGVGRAYWTPAKSIASLPRPATPVHPAPHCQSTLSSAPFPFPQQFAAGSRRQMPCAVEGAPLLPRAAQSPVRLPGGPLACFPLPCFPHLPP